MALVAVWLTVLAPTVSRTATAVFVFPDLGAWCEASPSGHHDDTRSGHDDGDTAACGYCTLFAQSPALGTSFFGGHVAPVAGPTTPSLPLTAIATPVAIHHASPRGPPVVAHA